MRHFKRSTLSVERLSVKLCSFEKQLLSQQYNKMNVYYILYNLHKNNPVLSYSIVRQLCASIYKKLKSSVPFLETSKLVHITVHFFKHWLDKTMVWTDFRSFVSATMTYRKPVTTYEYVYFLMFFNIQLVTSNTIGQI